MKENENVKVNEDFFEKGELKSRKTVFVVIASVVFLLLVVFGGYFYFNRPDLIVRNAINTLYQDFKKAFNNNIRIYDKLSVQGDLRFSTNLDGLEQLSDDVFSFKYGVDNTKSSLYSEIAWTENESTIFGIIYSIIDKNVYMKFSESDKVILSDSEEDSANFDFNNLINNKALYTANNDYIYRSLKDEFIKALDMSKLKKTKDTIKIDGNNKKVNKVSYKLDGSNVKNIVSNFVKGVNGNKKLLEEIGESFQLEVSEVKSYFETFNNYEFSDLGELNIYTDFITTSLLKFELVNDVSEYSILFGEVNEINVKSNGIETIFKVKSNSSEELVIDYEVSNAGISGSLVMKSKETDKDVIEGSLDFKIKYFMYDFGVNFNYKNVYNSDIPSMDITNTVKSSEMSESEIMDIFKKIEEKVNNSNLFKIFNSFTGSVN